MSRLFSLLALSVLSLAASAQPAPPPCPCECPSIEEQVQQRVDEYKAQVEQELNALKRKLSDKSDDELKSLQNQINEWIDELRRSLDTDEAPATEHRT